MPGIINQHNPAIAKNAPYIRVIHLMNSKGSLHLNDVFDDAINKKTQYQVQSYIPFGKTIDILMTDRVLTSYQQGAIKMHVEAGRAAAFILYNRDIVQAEIGATYTVSPSDDLILVSTASGAAFVTLPTLSDVAPGFEVEIKKTTTDGNQVQVSTPDGKFIDTMGSLAVIDGSQESIRLKVDEDGHWWIVPKIEATGGGGGPATLNLEAAGDMVGVATMFASADVIKQAKPRGLVGRATLFALLSEPVVTGGGGPATLNLEAASRMKGKAFMAASGEAIHNAEPRGLVGTATMFARLTPTELDRRDYIFAQDKAVPSSGGLIYMIADGVVTSSVPVVLSADSYFQGGSIRVNVADATRSFVVEYLLNGVVVETLNLPTSTLKTTAFNFTTFAAVGDEIAVRVVRATGIGKSDFDEMRVALELSEL